MNKSAFFFGGLVAGLVLIIFGIAQAELFLVNEDVRFFAGLDFRGTGLTIALTHAMSRLVVGFGIFIIYALAANKFSDKEAVLGATLLAWILLYLPAMVLYYDLGLLDIMGLVKGGAWGAAEALVAITAGRLVAKRTDHLNR